MLLSRLVLSSGTVRCYQAVFALVGLLFIAVLVLASGTSARSSLRPACALCGTDIPPRSLPVELNKSWSHVCEFEMYRMRGVDDSGDWLGKDWLVDGGLLLHGCHDLVS